MSVTSEESKNDYKNSVYAQNDSMSLCLYYETKTEENKTERAFRIISLFELAQLKLKKISELFQLQDYNNIVKKKSSIPLYNIIQVGKRVILFKESLEELKDMGNNKLLNRLFVVYKFNDVASTKYIYLQNHIEARKNEELGDGDTSFDTSKYQSRLKLRADEFTCVIENKHFLINIDGSIKWLI